MNMRFSRRRLFAFVAGAVGAGFVSKKLPTSDWVMGLRRVGEVSFPYMKPTRYIIYYPDGETQRFIGYAHDIKIRPETSECTASIEVYNGEDRPAEGLECSDDSQDGEASACNAQDGDTQDGEAG